MSKIATDIIKSLEQAVVIKKTKDGKSLSKNVITVPPDKKHD